MTATHPLKLVVVLKQIRYSGDNIGNDLAFAFEVNGTISSFEQKIAAGKSRSVDKILWKAPAMEGDKVTFQVNAIVTEQDLVFSDIGQAEITFAYDVTQTGAKKLELQVAVEARGEGKRTAIFSLHIETAIREMNYSRFDETLTYMYQELITNAQSGDLQTIKEFLSDDNILAARLLWFILVRSGGKWDHKPKLERKLGLKTSSDYYFPVRGAPEYEWFYDIWSNIHFGFVGRAAGFEATTLQDYAGSGLPGAGKNDEGDVLSVQIGIDLWDKHQLSLLQFQMQDAILSHLHDYLSIQQQHPEVKVVIDWIDGNLQ
jgi:hypothetical protein